jgi:hypothetical protein
VALYFLYPSLRGHAIMDRHCERCRVKALL